MLDKLFYQCPIDVLNLILEFQGYHKNRNGKYIQQLNMTLFKNIRDIPKLNCVYRFWGYEVNFIKQLIPEFVYEEVHQRAYKLKYIEGRKNHPSTPTSVTNIHDDFDDIKKYIDNSIQNICETYELGMNVKFTIKPIVTIDDVTWVMTTYYLVPKSYSYKGYIHWEETMRNTIQCVSHK
jgi:hypothetical protein